MGRFERIVNHARRRVIKLKKRLETFTLFSVISTMTTSAIREQQVFAEEKDITVEINYTVKMENQNHLVHLTICVDDKNVSDSLIIVYFPHNTKEIILKKVLTVNTCRNYEVEIEAKHANRIGVIVA